MRYCEYRPIQELRTYVECYWTLEGPASDGPVSVERILPDGSIELIFNFADRFRRFHASTVELQPRSLVAGQMKSHAAIQPTGVVRLAGVKFRPAGAFTVFRFPLQELTGHIADLASVLGKAGTEIEERVLKTSGGSETMELFDRVLLKTLDVNRTPDRTVVAALDFIFDSGGVSDVRTLAVTLGVGERQLQRKFREHVGLSPKSMLRLARFREVLRSIEGGRFHRWSDVAHDCGYFDQSHFIHDFKHFSGVDPSDYLLPNQSIARHLARLGRTTGFYNTVSAA